MAIPKEMYDRLTLLCEKFSINKDDALKFIRQVVKVMDGYYLFDSGNKIDLILYSRVFIYYLELRKDNMNSITRHISDISKITTSLDEDGIDVGIMFGHDEGIEFSIPFSQYGTWMGFYRTLKVYWANSKK